MPVILNTDIGANASAEDAGDDVEDTKVKVNNVVASFRLQSTQFDKKGFLSYLKGTMPNSHPPASVILQGRKKRREKKQ